VRSLCSWGLTLTAAPLPVFGAGSWPSLAQFLLLGARSSRPCLSQSLVLGLGPTSLSLCLTGGWVFTTLPLPVSVSTCSRVLVGICGRADCVASCTSCAAVPNRARHSRTCCAEVPNRARHSRTYFVNQFYHLDSRWTTKSKGLYIMAFELAPFPPIQS